MSNPYQNLEPIGDRIILKADEAKQEETASGIIIPAGAQPKPQTATVVAMGRGRFSDHGILIPLRVKIGDRVVFNSYAASEFKFNNETLHMLHEHEINCILHQ